MARDRYCKFNTSIAAYFSLLYGRKMQNVMRYKD